METPLIDLPEIEYLDGQPYPKVSPRLTHALLQAALVRVLGVLTENRGILVPELRVDLGAGAPKATEFLPDVSYISFERLATLSGESREKPRFSPDIAIEVRSPSDDVRYLQRKIARYISTGSLLVLDVDPELRCISAHNREGRRTFMSGDCFKHDAFRGSRSTQPQSSATSASATRRAHQPGARRVFGSRFEGTTTSLI